MISETTIMTKMIDTFFQKYNILRLELKK